MNTPARQAHSRSISRPRRRAVLAWATLVALAVLGIALPSSAAAAPVLEVAPDGSTKLRNNPLVPAADLPAPPAGATAAGRRPRPKQNRTVPAVLSRLRSQGQIDPELYERATAAYTDATALVRRLTGSRRIQMQAPVIHIERIAAAGQLTPSRVLPLILTLERNAEYWRKSPMPSHGRRITFKGSQLIWQFYAGQGLQLQMLANWGYANALWATTSVEKRRMLNRFLEELVPLAANRAGGIAWEYYFSFGGGRPPWTSGMSQGTAIQALARASEKLNRPELLRVATRALPVFNTNAPTGVRIWRGVGRANYLLYSFDRRLLVLNGFLQALIGLYDYAEISGNQLARRLFDQGNAEALAILPLYDTGRAQRYSLGGAVASRPYQELVVDFLKGLCDRTGTARYCQYEQKFAGYLRR
jgi:hypothetical protein